MFCWYMIVLIIGKNTKEVKEELQEKIQKLFIFSIQRLPSLVFQIIPIIALIYFICIMHAVW